MVKVWYWWLGGDSVMVPVVSTIVGACASLTVMVCTPLVVLFAASLAVHVIVVTPTGYGALSAWLSLRTPVTVTPGQLSAPVAVPGFTMALHELAGASTVWSAGTLKVGAVLSITV